MAREPGVLTERQQRFVEAYAVTGNAAESARRAGYKCPDPEGKRLLRNAPIVAALSKLTEKRKNSAIADREERSQFLTKVVRGKMKDADMKDRLKASELLSKMQGDFLERHEIVSGSLIDVMVYVPNNARG